MTEIPEPAAAPAVDDDLLRDLHRVAGVGSAWSTKPEEWAARLLASEPMQRVRAAWTAEAVMTERMEWNPVVGRQERLLRQVGRELDEARAAKDLHKERQQELEAEVETLRATQQIADLPQVHTAERRGEYVYVELGHNCGVYETRESAADMAALGLAALGVFDAEAADTSSDGEPLTLLDELSLFHDEELSMGDERRRARFAAIIDAHRARGGQEAGQ